MLIELGLFYLGARLVENAKRKKAEREAQEAKRIQANSKQAQMECSESGEVIPSEDEGERESFQSSGMADWARAFVAENKVYKRRTFWAMGFFLVGKVIPIFNLIGFGTFAWASLPYMRDVERSIVRDRKVNIDVLFFMGSLITLHLKQYFTASINLWMTYMANQVVGRVTSRSELMLTGIFDQLPTDVWTVVDGTEIKVPLSRVKEGDMVLVAAGEVIPVDGVIAEGIASVDQRALTGESQPAEKGPGDIVYANTVIHSGNIKVETKTSGQETVSSKIVQVLQQSTAHKSEVQLKGEEWANKATLPMFLLSFPIWLWKGASATAVFIFSHPGYRIRLLAPLATFEHTMEASENGVLVKDGRALEALSGIDTVIFDKTGTLTTDEPVVGRISAYCKDFNQDEVLKLAATAENKMTHPIARAILTRAEEEGINTYELQDSDYKIGYGITVTVNEKVIRVGSIRFMEEQKLELSDAIKQTQEEAYELGNSLVLVSADDQIIGAIELEPQVREEAARVVEKLRAMGIGHIAIISGDHKEPTRKLAESLGMDEYFHDVLPEGKADIIKDLQAKGRKVCFVGDGINDSIAMQNADVSVSLRGASTIAQDVAEVLLLDGDLEKIPFITDVSNRLDKELSRRLKLTIAPGIINLASIFLFPIGILTSLVINTGFFFWAARNPTYLIKDLPEEEEDAA